MTQNNQQPTPKISAAHKAFLTISIMLATLMQILDTTIANVALPHMQGSLSATQDQVTWILTSYIIVSAIMTSPTGWLVGRFGSKNVLLVAIVGFTIASALCGVASSITQMVAYRMLQGAFGAAIVPTSQTILLDINPKEKHAVAMAIWGMGIMIGPILGPVLGGYLTEHYSWRFVFYINLPIGVLSFLGVSAFLGGAITHKNPFDAFGFLTLSLAIGTMQLILDRGEQVAWFESIEIISYSCVSVSAFWMFLFHSYFTAHPFLNPLIFRDRNYLTAVIFIFCVGTILMGTLALLPSFMQNLMGYTVLDVGLLMAPRGIGTMVAIMFVGKSSGKVDLRLLIFLGLVLMALSLYEMSQFSTFVPVNQIIWTGFIQGMGLGVIFSSLTTIGFSTIDPKLRPEATSFFSLMRNLGGSVGISLVISLLSRGMHKNRSYLAEHVTPYNMAEIFQGRNLSTALGSLNAEITSQASTIAYVNNFTIMMWVAICLAPMVLLLRNPPTNQTKVF